MQRVAGARSFPVHPLHLPVAEIYPHPVEGRGRRYMKQIIGLYIVVVLGVVTAVYLLPPFGKPAIQN